MFRLPTLGVFQSLRSPAVRPLRQLRTLAVALACAMLIAVAVPRFAAAQAQTGTPLSNSTALYARVLRLSHNANASLNGAIVASVVAFPSTGAEVDIYSSANGAQFTKIGAITDSSMKGGLCCGTLYELPSKVGNLAPGTLLWSGSVGQSSTTQPMQLEVYASSDQGHTWTYLSNCATGATIGTTAGGLWEPQFTVASDGALVCFYSDEQQAGHSQLIHQVRSYDGIHWQDSTFTIASTVQADRPGMAVVTKLPNGTYFMSYELCGPAACTVFDRISPDGWNWGDPTNMGNRVVTAAGQWLEHAPTNAWAPSVASANGTILLVGQMMYDSDGQVSSGNGVTILTNHTVDGTGAWSTMPAPVQVPNAYNNYCPNYSSPLLPSVDGQSVLELASAYNGSTCEMYYGTGPILAGTLTPTVTVTPPAGSTTTAQAVSVTVSVSGTLGVTPIGTVTINAGNYTSTPATLTNGTATVTIPANELSAGTVTLTASYSGDANYTPASGSAPATITQAPTFSISAPNMTLKRGATTGNTATITVTPAGGFTGMVTLSAQIASGPAGATLDYPTLAFGSSNKVSITSASPGTATLTILTTAGTSTQARNAGYRSSRFGAVSLCFILFGLPFTIRLRRSGARFLVLLLVSIVVVTGGISGCNGNGGSSTVAAAPGTLPGTYVINVSGTSPNASATGLFTLTLQ